MYKQLKDNYFCEQFEIRAVPLLRYLNAQKIDDIPHWIHSKYLYYLDKSLWFSCSYDWQEHIIGTGIGRLFRAKDCMPRLMILEDYKYFLTELYKEAYIDKSDKKELKKLNSLPAGIDLIVKTLPIILSNYAQLRYLVKDKIDSKEKRIKPYLIKEIVDINMLMEVTAHQE